jgi:hypothetical protein
MYRGTVLLHRRPTFPRASDCNVRCASSSGSLRASLISAKESSSRPLNSSSTAAWCRLTCIEHTVPNMFSFLFSFFPFFPFLFFFTIIHMSCVAPQCTCNHGVRMRWALRLEHRCVATACWPHGLHPFATQCNDVTHTLITTMETKIQCRNVHSRTWKSLEPAG